MEEAEFEAAEATANATSTPTPMAESTPTATPQATGTPAPSPTAATETVVQEATQAQTTAFGSAGGSPLDVLTSLPPGGLFFLGGLAVLAVVAAWWYLRSYRPLYG